jgi:hypothetical protein
MACQSLALSLGGNDFPGLGWHEMEATEKHLLHKGYA